MSDTQPTETDDQTEGPKQLREARDRAIADAEAARTEAADAKAAQRELAFMKAKVDTSTPLAQHVMASYTGDLTAEAVTEFATSLGLLASEESTEATGAAQDEEARKAVQEAHLLEEQSKGTSGTPNTSEKPPGDFWEESYEEFEADRKGGLPADQARKNVMAKVIAAGAANDDRVVFSGFTDDQIAAGDAFDRSNRKR